MGSLEWTLLIILSILWGGSFFFIGVAVKSLPPLTIVTMRVALAAIVLNIVIRIMGYSLIADRRRWSAFLTMGFLNNMIPFLLIVWGQTHIESGLASILNATSPLFGVVVAHVYIKDERITGGRLAGLMVGFAGVVLIIGPDTLKSLGVNTLAQIAVLGAALSYAFASVFARRFSKLGVPPMVVATGQVTFSTLILIPLVLVIDKPWTLPVPGWETWGALAGLAVLSTALAYVIYFRIIATAGATNSLLVTFLIPVSAILLGTTFLGETLDSHHFVGMGIIGLGLAAIDGRLIGLLSNRLKPRRK